MTAVELKTKTRKQLASMARKDQVSGWHAMRKDELIQALLALHRGKKSVAGRKTNGSSAANGSGRRNRIDTTLEGSRQRTSPREAARRAAGQACRRVFVAAAPAEDAGTERRDHLVAEVCDPHWILVRWSLSRAILTRAEAALGLEWHGAVPVIRVFDMTADDSSTAAKVWVRDVDVHGTIDHWYVHIDDPSRMYRLYLGYRALSGRFFELAHSDRVRMPVPGAPARRRQAGTNGQATPGAGQSAGPGTMGRPMSRGWSDVYSSRPLAEAGGLSPLREDQPVGDLPLQVEIELLIHGATRPGAQLAILGESVPAGADGQFSLRLLLPDGRQVIPVVATAAGGTHERTVILAIERNTKELAPQLLEDLPG